MAPGLPGAALARLAYDQGSDSKIRFMISALDEPFELNDSLVEVK